MDKSGEAEREKPIWTGDSPFCPKCGEFPEDEEPVSRRDFRGTGGYDLDWKETMRCPKCGTLFEYRNGNS